MDSEAAAVVVVEVVAAADVDEEWGEAVGLASTGALAVLG